MSQFGEQVDNILAKPGSQWTPEEHGVISRLIGQGHRMALREALDKARDNQLVNNQTTV